jgi:cytochrome c-type biogenesis protein CcmH/NrfG
MVVTALVVAILMVACYQLQAWQQRGAPEAPVLFGIAEKESRIASWAEMGVARASHRGYLLR